VLDRLGRRAEPLVEAEGTDADRALLALEAALLALDQGRTDDAEAFYREALAVADCHPGSPCALDRADHTVLRAHWLARRHQPDRAFEALRAAVTHPGWTATLLESPDLAPLRQDPRWREVENAVRERVRAEEHVADP
ncbi:MAG: hypothetical protein KDD11_10525, partial [Acidobacteria bacterium]|nr:hypothetical protein [Acidobacteriota bacterium]